MPQSAYATATCVVPLGQLERQPAHLVGDQLRLVVQQRRQRVYGDLPAAALDDLGDRLGDGAAGDHRGALRRSNAELVDEPVVELGAVGELDIGHLLQQRRAPARSRTESSAIFAPSPATLPAATIRSTGSFGTRPMRTADAAER